MSFPLLPPIDTIDPRLPYNNLCDHYGAISVARNYCGYGGQPWLEGLWQHGCFPPWMDEGPDAFPYAHVYNARVEWGKVFVARRAEAVLLRNQGYKRVEAIGMPFIYLPKLDVERRPGALLVVPNHSLPGMGFADLTVMDAYADFIQSIRGHFSTVVASVHSGCLANGYWIRQFEERGIPWVLGADIKDRNALLRMQMLFSQFEYVTTNAWGSHVPYALHTGAKLTVCGPVPKQSAGTLLNDAGFGGDRSLAAYYVSKRYADQETRFLASFHRQPHEGVVDKELASSILGCECKRSPEELMDLFAWSTKGRVVDVAVRAKNKIIRAGNRITRGVRAGFLRSK